MDGLPTPLHAGLEAVLELHRASLRRFLLARTGDAAIADDLLQEMWVKLRSSGPVGVEHGRSYLFRMAHNLVLDRARGERRRAQREAIWSDHAFGRATPEGELADERLDAEAALIERERVAALASAIANLPPAAGRAFRLHKLEGMSHEDVAAQLGISRSGVEKHMATAMAHLRRALRDCG